MEILKKKILEEGKAIGKDIVKVDGFLNHQILFIQFPSFLKRSSLPFGSTL